MEPGKLYIEQLKSITALVRQFGKRPMFWADVNSGARIFVKYPELFAELPKDVIAVPWHYHVQKDYSGFVAPFAREKVPEDVCPPESGAGMKLRQTSSGPSKTSTGFWVTRASTAQWAW